MRFKYCIKIKFNDCTTRSKYFNANNPTQALSKCAKYYKDYDVLNMSVLGDALPVPKNHAAKIIIKQRLKKQKQRIRWLAALKYQRLTGNNPYETKPAKN